MAPHHHPVALMLVTMLYTVPVVHAGHCYRRSGETACIVPPSGGQGACAWCNGACQMAYDSCEKAIEVTGTPYFEDATDEIASGSNPKQRNYGVAITDVDGDGLFDAFVAAYSSPSGTPANLVLSHKDGKLKNIAASTVPDVRRKTLGVTACDIDGDGREEIYLLNLDAYSGDGGSSAARDQILSKRPGQTIFGDLLDDEQNGKVLNQASGRSVACIDRRGDGNYSVFVSNYASNGSPKAMLVEMTPGTSTLVDVAPELGMDTANGGRAVVAGQVYDEHVSLFVNNEGGNGGNSGRNYLYEGLAGSKFQQVASDRGVEDAGQTGRGTIMMDANGDGQLDLVYGNWNGYHRMYLQHADGKFIDAAPADMRAPSKIRTIIAADWDNDGYEEIFFNNIPGANRLFSVFGDSDAEFGADWKPQAVGAAEEPQGYGTGAGVADFDGDGRLELLISHGESDPNYQGVTLFRAAGGENNHYIRIYPTTVNGAPARGALVQLTMNDGRVQTRNIDSGSGYLCAQEPVAHFGLGLETSFKTITVRWPGVSKHLVIRTGELAVDKQHTVAHPEVTGAGAFTTADPTLAGGHAAIAWDGKAVADLHNEYWDIFAESGNRNAASHLWVSFLVDRGGSMDTATFETMFSGFCPVSGSPVSNGRSPYQLSVKSAVEGQPSKTGFVYFCCSPCVCDTVDLVRTDTRTVYTQDGKQTYDFLVIGDPCSDVSKIPGQAPELKCKNGKLEKAIRSDNGHIIIGMLHEKPLGTDYFKMGVTDSDCKARADAGYPSGMGTIFREVAQISALEKVDGGAGSSDGGAGSSDGGASSSDEPASSGSKTCSKIISANVVNQIETFVKQNNVVVFGVQNVRCTDTAERVFKSRNICHQSRYFSAESTMWKYFQCLYPDEKVGNSPMHSYVYMGGEFIGNGFRLLQDQGDYRCSDGNAAGKGKFCLSVAGFNALVDDAGAGPCPTTATAVSPPTSTMAITTPTTQTEITTTAPASEPSTSTAELDTSAAHVITLVFPVKCTDASIALVTAALSAGNADVDYDSIVSVEVYCVGNDRQRARRGVGGIQASLRVNSADAVEAMNTLVLNGRLTVQIDGVEVSAITAEGNPAAPGTTAAATTAPAAPTTAAADPQTSLDWAVAAGFAPAPPSAEAGNSSPSGSTTNNGNPGVEMPLPGRKLSGPQIAGVAVAIVFASVLVGVLRWKTMMSSSNHGLLNGNVVRDPTYDSTPRQTPPGTPPSGRIGNVAPEPTPNVDNEEFSC